jgi:hypothetical protein
MTSAPSRRRRRLIAAALLAAPLGCGPFHRQPGEDAHVIFTNESLEQVHVYAIGPNSNQVRLGAVSPLRVETLRVPAIVLTQGGSVSLSARLTATTTASAISDAFTLSAGDTVRARLTADRGAILIVAGRK